MGADHTPDPPSSHPMRQRVHALEGGWEAKCIIEARGYTLVLPKAVGHPLAILNCRLATQFPPCGAGGR
jgi:hypothetical protein